MAAFDLESTGVDVENDRIVTATLVRIHQDQVESRSWLVAPGVPIPPEATAVHGVTDEHAVQHGQDPASACAQILAELDECWTAGRPVVIYNAVFDLTMLDRELRRHCGQGMPMPGTIIDPFVIDKELDRYRRGSRTLAACVQHYGVKLEDAHTSLGDALAAARVVWRQAQRYPQISRVDDLNELQARWRAIWAADFEKYLAKHGKPEPVDGHWPIRPYTEQATP